MCGCKANTGNYRGVSRKQPRGKGVKVYRRKETTKEVRYNVTAHSITNKTSYNYGM